MSTLKYIIRAKNEGQTKIVEVEISATFDDIKQKIQGLFKGKTITPLVCASTKATISNEEEFKAALEASKSEKSFVIEAGSQEEPKKEEPKKAAAAAPAASSKPSTPRKEEPKKAAAAPATSSKPSTPRKEEPKKEEPKKAAAPAPAAGANKCVKCSAKLPDGAKFCNKCGAPQNAAPAAAAAAAPKEEPKKEEPKKEENCCAACGKPLCGSSISLGSGENYHPECFVCGECGKGIRGQYMKIDGKFICGACYEAKHQEVCAGCGKPINGQYVGVGDKNYHPECFVCSKCNKQINGRFRYGRDGGLLCPSCN